MTDNKDLKYIQKNYNPYIPKTETRLVVEDLYPDLVYEDIREQRWKI